MRGFDSTACEIHMFVHARTGVHNGIVAVNDTERILCSRRRHGKGKKREEKEEMRLIAVR